MEYVPPPNPLGALPTVAPLGKPAGVSQPLTPPPRQATNTCPCGQPGVHPQFMQSAAGPYIIRFCGRCAEINDYQNYLANQLGQAQPYEACDVR